MSSLRTDLSLQIYLGLFLDVSVGLCFGEPAADLHATERMLSAWLLVTGVVMTMSLSYPPLESASFFRPMVEPDESLSLADLYFTSNLFHSLANAARSA